MGIKPANYQCPGCAETMNISFESHCPLCDTPISGKGSGQKPGLTCHNCNNLAPLDASTCPSCGSKLAGSGGFWFVLPIILIAGIFFMGILAAIAVPNFQKARSRANQRACFANQKTIAGATEMYNLDFNTRVTELTPSFMNTLVSEGYLMSVPQCPGRNASKGSYSMDSSGEVSCSHHGSVSGRYQVERP